jgi:membrane-bound metal-dependent hydrolase YbcI (DUF457 family)
LPLTPLHYPVAYFIHKLGGNLSLPGLIVGSLVPDLEIPFILLIFGVNGPNRLVLHSLLGSASLGTILGIIITIKFYPCIVGNFFGVDKEKVESKCKLSSALTISVLMGTISHVLLDFTNHLYNPILWPFLDAEMIPSPIYLLLGEQFGYLWIQVIMGTLLLVILFIERKNLAENLLVG